jgi:ATP-binding protein involved in chromosome partitioning
MMGIRQRPTISPQEKMVPPGNYGVKLMSMGFLIQDDSPVIWRGPMIMKTIQQFFHSVDWGALDYLLVDLPPGTGDAQLSLCQTVPLDGGVIVTTPQEASLGVVRKGIGMFEKVHVPILGIVGKMEAARKNVPFLGEVPIYTEIRQGGDEGLPVVVSNPKGKPAAAFAEVARNLEAALKR